MDGVWPTFFCCPREDGQDMRKGFMPVRVSVRQQIQSRSFDHGCAEHVLASVLVWSILAAVSLGLLASPSRAFSDPVSTSGTGEATGVFAEGESGSIDALGAFVQSFHFNVLIPRVNVN